MIISAIIVFILRKLKINEKIALISNVVLILFAIASIVSIFVGNIGQIFTTDFVMPGPTVKIPSIVLLLVWISIFSVEFYKTEDSKYGILKFILGSILASGILLTVFSILSYKSLNMDLNKNQLIKQIIQGVCGTGIVGYYLYTLKKFVRMSDEKRKRLYYYRIKKEGKILPSSFNSFIMSLDVTNTT